jgi:fatty acid desaturase
LPFLVWAEVLSALPRNVAVALCPSRSVSGLTPSLTAPLCGTLLLVPHRHRHEQHHEHDRERDRDHDDAGANREDDKVLILPLLRPNRSSSIRATTVKP